MLLQNWRDVVQGLHARLRHRTRYGEPRVRQQTRYTLRSAWNLLRKISRVRQPIPRIQSRLIWIDAWLVFHGDGRDRRLVGRLCEMDGVLGSRDGGEAGVAVLRDVVVLALLDDDNLRDWTVAVVHHAKGIVAQERVTHRFLIAVWTEDHIFSGTPVLTFAFIKSWPHCIDVPHPVAVLGAVHQAIAREQAHVHSLHRLKILAIRRAIGHVFRQRRLIARPAEINERSRVERREYLSVLVKHVPSVLLADSFVHARLRQLVVVEC